MKFSYQVRDQNGKKISGMMEASSERIVAERLLAERYLISSIKPARFAGLRAALTAPASGGVHPGDLTMFYFQIGNMVDAGISLLVALDTVSDQMESAGLKKVVKDVMTQVENGSTFSDAMARHDKIFPLLHRSMVQVGEASGHLGNTLRHVAALQESQNELKHQVRSAFAYPIVLLVASIGVVVLMMVWIVPTFTAIFEKAGVALPLPTRMVYTLSTWMKANFLLLGGALAAAGIGIRMALKAPAVKRQWYRFLMKLPALGLMMRRVEVARWSRSMALMLASGVPILQALAISKNLTGNLLIQDALAEAHVSVQAGRKLADIFEKNRIFPKDVIQMIATGEASGSLDKMLYKVADFYDQLVTRTLKQITGMIEPIFIFFTGGMIGFIMLAILLPMFDMIKVVKPH